MATQPPSSDPNLDLGFGSVVSRESRKRLLNRNGTFNVKREGLGFLESLSAYHHLLTISWRQFLTYIVVTYLLANVIFALLYMACGPHTLSGLTSTTLSERFVQAFFFSVDTVATIGYGNIVPATFMANVLVTIESLVGLLGFSVVAPMSVIVPASTCGRNASCCALLKRWISSAKRIVPRPVSRRSSASRTISRTRGTPSVTALNGTNSRSV